MMLKFPFTSNFVVGDQAKAFAVLEGLIAVPMVAVLVGYLASFAPVEPWVQRAVGISAAILLIVPYGALWRQ
jgi:hypothetical protein